MYCTAKEFTQKTGSDEDIHKKIIEALRNCGGLHCVIFVNGGFSACNYFREGNPP